MRFACSVLAALALVAPSQAPEEPGRVTTVGMPARIEELVLPGPELEVAPADASAPLVVRIARVSPHGDAHRYDLEYWAYEPGEHDLRDALRRKDGTPLVGRAEPAQDLPPIRVRVDALLPPGQVLPSPPPASALPALGGYRALLWAGGALWVAGLFAILFVGRRRRREEAAESARPRTLADRLRPLVQRAIAGELSRAERAQLELGLVAYWRRRLGLEAERPERALAELHAHAQAGPLLAGLEEWLHRPGPVEGVDLGALLAPYRDLPPDALELAAAEEAKA